MVEWVNVAEEARVGLEEVMVETNEILTGLPLTRHNLILALLLSASPQREREQNQLNVYMLATVGRRRRDGCQIHSITMHNHGSILALLHLHDNINVLNQSK